LSERETKYKVVVDCGNGMGGYLMPRLVELYSSIEFVELYWEPDGTYPNHPADPSKLENMQDLMHKVIETKADLGVAFDGDADRAYFVDEKGQFIEGNSLVASIATTMLHELSEDANSQYNPAIVYSQPQSRVVPFAVLEAGGVPVPTKQGHTFIKSNMEKYNAVYGGESTGHHYYGAFNFMDSGAITVAKVLQILIEQDKLASDLAAKYIKNFHLSGEISIKLSPEQSFADFASKLSQAYPEATISRMDGLSLFYPDWKVNLRASNTEPLIRLNVETIGSTDLQQKVDEIKQVLGL
jgi:phosphomannomutase